MKRVFLFVQCVIIRIPLFLVVIDETSRDCAGVDGWTDVDGNWQSGDVC